MDVKLPAPDGMREDERGTVPLWRCPNCGEMKTIEEFGWRYRKDAYLENDIWHKQSWCKVCRGT